MGKGIAQPNYVPLRSSKRVRTARLTLNTPDTDTEFERREWTDVTCGNRWWKGEIRREILGLPVELWEVTWEDGDRFVLVILADGENISEFTSTEKFSEERDKHSTRTKTLKPGQYASHADSAMNPLPPANEGSAHYWKLQVELNEERAASALTMSKMNLGKAHYWKRRFMEEVDRNMLRETERGEQESKAKEDLNAILDFLDREQCACFTDPRLQAILYARRKERNHGGQL